MSTAGISAIGHKGDILMTIRNVNPGDLIKSSDWNDLVTALGALEARVTQLEGGNSTTAPKITQVLPTGAVMAGDTIRIYGSNFGFTQGAQSVLFGNTRATTFLSGSSDTLLIVQIPDPVEGATEAGTAMTMTVSNLYSFTTRAITIKSKPVIVTGGVQFTYKGSQPTTPTQNVPILYNFDIKSFASQDLMVTITPTIQVIPPLPAGVSDPGLPNLIKVIDSDGTERGDRQVRLLEGATKTISLRLSLPDQTNGLKYSLSATASAPGVSPVVESLPDQQVGQAGEQPDPTVTNFEFSMVAQGDATFSTDTGGVSGVDGTLKIRQGTMATIEMRTQFGNISAGTTENYQLSAPVDTPASGWSASVNPITQNPLPVQGPGGLDMIYFDITAPGTATTTIVRLTLTRQGAATNNKRIVAYRVQVI
jgi:hypothetical protein